MNRVSGTSRAKSSSLTNMQLESSRERKDWGRRSRQKIFEEIISIKFSIADEFYKTYSSKKLNELHER